jgi:hypothetical protein
MDTGTTFTSSSELCKFHWNFYLMNVQEKIIMCFKYGDLENVFDLQY